MKIEHVVEVLSEAPEFVVSDSTTADDARRTRRDFGTFDAHEISGRRWQGLSPWERHSDGDELLLQLEGTIEVTLLTDNDRTSLELAPGSIFVVPKGIWHRTFARHTVISFGVSSIGDDEISFDDDPRSAR